jgi:hypothetical protein
MRKSARMIPSINPATRPAFEKKSLLFEEGSAVADGTLVDPEAEMIIVLKPPATVVTTTWS